MSPGKSERFSIGKLATSAVAGGASRAHTYDLFGRLATQSLSIDGTAYTISNAYDGLGRVEKVSYPTGFEIRNIYNSLGYLFEVRNSASNALYWRAVAMTPAGITDEDYGNGTGVVRLFHPTTYRVSQIATIRDSDSTVLQNHTIGYDSIGNVDSRTETTQALSETYTYDELNRLATVAGPFAKSYAYDDVGSITSKTGVGSYSYPSTGRVHAVSAAGGSSYTYDANGNMESGAGRTLTWTSFNLPATAQAGASTYAWTYDADLQRVKFVTPSETTIYWGAGPTILFEKVVKGGTTELKHIIHAQGKSVAQFTQRPGGTDDTLYFYRDHLGSTSLILDSAGNVAERLAYDAHGKRRFPNGGDDTSNTLTGVSTDRGFTDHEHLDELGLVHMNGRLFDPRLGRFLSPDPVVQNFFNPQNLNRYAYVLNNPFVYVDPTGYESEESGNGFRNNDDIRDHGEGDGGGGGGGAGPGVGGSGSGGGDNGDRRTCSSGGGTHCGVGGDEWRDSGRTTDGQQIAVPVNGPITITTPREYTPSGTVASTLETSGFRLSPVVGNGGRGFGRTGDGGGIAQFPVYPTTPVRPGPSSIAPTPALTYHGPWGTIYRGSSGLFSTTGPTLPVHNPQMIGHVFTPRHGLMDTTINRYIITAVARNPANFAGTSSLTGIHGYSQMLGNNQYWVYVTPGGIIRNGGINNPARDWDPVHGFNQPPR